VEVTAKSLETQTNTKGHKLGVTTYILYRHHVKWKVKRTEFQFLSKHWSGLPIRIGLTVLCD